MRHAYLIIVHHELLLLRTLVELLDDERNDIFIHFDKKMKEIPVLQTQFSTVVLVQERVDVRWGHRSQIEAEYVLFENASKKGDYAYYHLISGVHLPLYTQDYLHHYFAQLDQKQVLSPLVSPLEEQVNKVQRYNFFIKKFAKSTLHQILWRKSIQVQEFLGIRRHSAILYYKASNWLSITESAVQYILQCKKMILKQYKYSMCGDEFFVPTLLYSEPTRFTILEEPRLLLQRMARAHALTYQLTDLPDLMNSDCLFARKFSENHFDLVEKITKNLKSR